MADEVQSRLNATLKAYLMALEGVAQVVGEAAPEIAPPFQRRIRRLVNRLTLDSTRTALDASGPVLQTELAEFARQSSEARAHHRAELKSAFSAMEASTVALLERQKFYCDRLRDFSAQMESADYSGGAEGIRDIVVFQAQGLRQCLDSLARESREIHERIQSERAKIDEHLAARESTDPETGLLSRYAMESQVEMRKAQGRPAALLLFRFGGVLSAELAQRITTRLTAQFRQSDLIARWENAEFLVLMEAPPAVVWRRAQQVMPWISGAYLLDNGKSVDVTTEIQLLNSPSAEHAPDNREDPPEARKDVVP